MKIHDPPMTFKDAAAAERWAHGLANNQDANGSAVYRYASEWATRMERELAVGAKLEAVAVRTGNDADSECIETVLYAFAAHILADVWLHGESLRRWFNLHYQLLDEGEHANAVPGQMLSAEALLRLVRD